MHADDSQPSWSIGRTPVAEIGGLLFYRPEPVTARARPGRPALALAV
jgi:spore germination cell wall hydrolase CwlJ-like protein